MSSFLESDSLLKSRKIESFSDIKIPTKFFMSLALLVIGLTFMGAAYYQTIVIEEKAQVRSNELAEFTTLINGVEINIARARFYEKSFQIDRDLEQLNQFNVATSVIDDKLLRLQSLLRSEEDKQQIKQFQAIIDDYQDTFYDGSEALIEAGLTSDEGIAKELRGLLWATDALIIWLERTWLREQFDQTRSAIDEYIASGGVEVTSSDVNKNLTRLINQLEAAKVTSYQQNKVAVLENMREAQALFNELSTAIDRSAIQFNRVNFIIQKLVPAIEELNKLTGVYKMQNEDQQAADRLDMVTYFFLSMGLMIVAMAVAMSIAKYGVIDPINRIQQTVNRVREGDVTARSELETRDELGQLATILDALLDEKEHALSEKEEENRRLNSSIIELIQNVFRISQRDLTVRVPVAEDVTGAIADSINQLASSIESVLHDVNAVSNRVNNASVQVKSQSETVLNYATREQEEILETLQGLDSAIKAMELISKLALLSNNASQKAIKTSETAMDSVSQTINSITKIRQTIHEAEKRIKRLGERSQEIGGIVNLINNISERTHVLSLNASMHAASAGEAGRGLMVVVDEVQRLAENSREATAEIESLVNNIQLETADTINVMNTVITDVVEGTRLAEEAGERMDETRATTQTLVDSVMRIAQNSVKQAKVAEQLRERANNIGETSNATNAEMQQQAQLSDELVQAAEELQRSISVFKLAAS
ncbi:methyl-accepting chemotaxis protein [Pontibacterium granulatum]|uniref:methyl-accepting chemotaxis protein n=1 Tax=Pontibacterium granulatum TaxID=2036029 RepID=UPI00249B84ED|nr:methyl-accepting chemotaxis protein [Pontibacterium granulatum]MDI3325324.1 methyl-accepting chemotaxis protein [Pontibacterium granulatum]